MPRLLCIGDVNLDVAITVPHGMIIGSDNEGTVETFGGGSAANVAAWAARSQIPTRFVGVVGTDLAGHFLVGELCEHGVDVIAVRRPRTRTRSIAVIVDADGERSMVSDVDKNAALDPDDIDGRWFDDVDWLHLTAYTWFNARSRPTFTALIELARSRGIPASIDPSAVALLHAHGDRSELLDAFDGAAVLFPNHDEARCLTGLDDPAAAAQALLDISACVVVTCGAEGAHVARRDHDSAHVPAEHVEGVNTLGCGDAFVGGFLAARLSGRDDLDAARAGVRSAGTAFQLSSAR